MPILTSSEIDSLLTNAKHNAVNNGYLYLSFMGGEKEGYETPSFNKSIHLYVHYHNSIVIKNKLHGKGFEILNEWHLDYHEPDGSITKDIVIIAKKVNQQRVRE